MSTLPRVPLTPVQTLPGDAQYQALLAWPFAAVPFYEGQITRLLASDVPFRVRYSTGGCRVWVYRDPDGNSVGFGALDVCAEYAKLAGGQYHTYIPVLAVNPAFRKRGHGRNIVEHLVAEAALEAQAPLGLSDLLFLDVYTANRDARALYEKCGFTILNPDTPVADADENNEAYFIMARKVAIAMA